MCSAPSDLPLGAPVLVVGAGRMGGALARALRAAGVDVEGPVGRGADGANAAVVLLAVPDREIAAAAAAIAPHRIVGHMSGATALDALAPHEAFSLHPLTTVTTADAAPAAASPFRGVRAAVAATSARAARTARALAAALELTVFEVADADRDAYHAAAAISSNFLVTLEGFAAELGATAGVDRAALAPLVRAAVENWAAHGAVAALTGPIARGDEQTVARHRRAVAQRLPQRLALFDALATATRDLAAASAEATPAATRPVTVVRTVAELRAALGPARAGSTGFVPTMGALHEGHLSLVRAARAENDTVLLSIFVNPTQFTEAADLDAYPRVEDADVALAASAGVDIVFAPSAAEMYPAGFATTVRVAGALTETLEGAVRGRAHFDGVATVVTKLLLAAQPDTAYFGAKDAQQVVVVRRAVADLNLPVRIAVVPISRDPDGLARSSRNARLSADERRRALAIPRALDAVQREWQAGETDAAALRRAGGAVLSAAGLDAEYFAVVDADALTDIAVVDRPALIAVAARVGETRLIDNVVLDPALNPGGS